MPTTPSLLTVWKAVSPNKNGTPLKQGAPFFNGLFDAVLKSYWSFSTARMMAL